MSRTFMLIVESKEQGFVDAIGSAKPFIWSLEVIVSHKFQWLPIKYIFIITCIMTILLV